MDKPENIYNALDNLESLTGRQFNFIGESNTTTLDNEYSISSLRVFVVMIVFTIAAFIVQKYHTVYTPTFSKKYEVLPSYQTIGYSAYKN
jgi:hypothetical protein